MLIRFVYNGALFFIAFFGFFKITIKFLRYGKRRYALKERLGLKPIDCALSPEGTIWIHAVSVGETKAIVSLVQQLKQRHPKYSIVISTITETGQVEAKRSLPGLDHYFILPLDFSWIIRRLVKQIKPKLLILSEGDFWYNLMNEVPHVVVVNGKISETSLSRFKAFPFFSKKLFSTLQILAVQSNRYANRFEQLGILPSKIVVTGNLKFDYPSPHFDSSYWKKELFIRSKERVITIGSTHAPEEEEILLRLDPLMKKIPFLKVLLVPRHPERFDSVALLLLKKNFSFARFSDPLHKKGDKKIILVDAMGLLGFCFQLSEVSILGGSFIPNIGGHNIMESVMKGAPVLYGPYMESQKDLVEIVTQSGAGRQVSLVELPAALEEWLTSPSSERREAGLKLAHEMQGATTRTLEILGPLIETS